MGSDVAIEMSTKEDNNVEMSTKEDNSNNNIVENYENVLSQTDDDTSECTDMWRVVKAWIFVLLNGIWILAIFLWDFCDSVGKDNCDKYYCEYSDFLIWSIVLVLVVPMGFAAMVFALLSWLNQSEPRNPYRSSFMVSVVMWNVCGVLAIIAWFSTVASIAICLGVDDNWAENFCWDWTYSK